MRSEDGYEDGYMDQLQRHFLVCLITGLIAILPVGGTVLLIVFAERSLSPLIPTKFYFPARAYWWSSHCSIFWVSC